MVKKENPSEIIQNFLTFLEETNQMYLDSKDQVDRYDENTIEWAHRFENAEKTDDLKKLGVEYKAERLARRKAKDTMLMCEKTHRFYSEELNRGTLKRLKTLLEQQKRTEEYLASEDKVYKSRRKLNDPL